MRARLLAILMLSSAVVRVVIAVPREFPRYLPDEYLYPLLARSFAHGNGVSILRATGEPLPRRCSASPGETPIWAIDGTAAQGIVLTEGLHARDPHVARRRPGLSPRQAAGSHAAHVDPLRRAWRCSVPGMFFASFLSADALGYLLALTAIAVCVNAVAKPGALGRGRRSHCHRTGVLRAGPVRDHPARRSCWRQSLRSGGPSHEHSERSPSRSVLPPRWLRSFRSSVQVLLGRYETVTTFSPSSEALHWVFSRHVPARSRRGRGVRPRRGRIIQSPRSPGVDTRARDCVCHDGPVRHGLARPDRLRDDGGNELRSIPGALPDHRRSAHRACLRLLAVGEASRSDGSRSLPGVGLLLVAMRLTLSQFTVVQGVADSPSLFAPQARASSGSRTWGLPA